MSSASDTTPPESDEPPPQQQESEPRWVTGCDPITPPKTRGTYVRHYRWLLSQAVPPGEHAIGWVPSGMVADVERMLNHLGYHTLRLLPDYQSGMTRLVAWLPVAQRG